MYTLILVHPIAWLPMQASPVVSLFVQVLLLLLPLSAGWISGELALFKAWVQTLSGFWAIVVNALVTAVITFLGAWVLAHLPGVPAPTDLNSLTGDTLLAIIAALLKLVFGATTSLVAMRRLRGLKH